MTAMVRIEWYCGMNVPGTGGFFQEPAECGTEFEEVIPAAEYEEGYSLAVCPKCGSDLTEADDNPTITKFEDDDALHPTAADTADHDGLPPGAAGPAG